MWKFDPTKFDPVVRTAADERWGASAIFLLAAFAFFLGGVDAFVFDQVSLPGRHGTSPFTGRGAHIVGAFCFLVTAYWLYKYLQAYQVSRLVSVSPYILAALVSVGLLILKNH